MPTRVQTVAKERYLAVACLLGADRTRYGWLIKDLENQYLLGNDNYPNTLDETYGLLISWKQDVRNMIRVVGHAGDGVNFANVEDISN
jgi:hypothetical protein